MTLVLSRATDVEHGWFCAARCTLIRVPPPSSKVLWGDAATLGSSTREQQHNLASTAGIGHRHSRNYWGAEDRECVCVCGSGWKVQGWASPAGLHFRCNLKAGRRDACERASRSIQSQTGTMASGHRLACGYLLVSPGRYTRDSITAMRIGSISDERATAGRDMER